MKYVPKFCIATVSIFDGKPDVSYYAYRPDAYGLHRVSDYHDKNVVWYDTEKEAISARFNQNDCIISICFAVSEEGERICC